MRTIHRTPNRCSSRGKRRRWTKPTDTDGLIMALAAVLICQTVPHCSILPPPVTALTSSRRISPSRMRPSSPSNLPLTSLFITVQPHPRPITPRHPHPPSPPSPPKRAPHPHHMTTPSPSNMEMQPTQPTPPLPSTSTRPPATQTRFQRPSTSSASPPPKIVVLGATGQIGRRIVDSLMSMGGLDMTVVAFVRDYDRALECFGDAMGRERGERRRGGWPNLQVVEGDLVPREEVFGFRSREEDEEDEEDEEEDDSPSPYSDLDPEDDVPDLPDDIDPNETLRAAIKDATVIISAVGTVRRTLPFADYAFFPWRIFRTPDTWCTDRRHPYYVNYRSMVKVLRYAEDEQRKREAALEKARREREEREGGEGDGEDEEEEGMDRIRIVRISDLCVAKPPWHLVTLFTNIVRSLVFRDQERAENVLLKSDLVDTIVLRPGDLTNDIRNQTTTSLQVDVSGTVPDPAYVGRDDVSLLTTILATSNLRLKPKNSIMRDIRGVTIQTQRPRRSYSPNDPRRRRKRYPRALRNNIHRRNKQTYSDGNNLDLSSGEREPRHWTVAVRWAGKELGQGEKSMGYPATENCLDHIVRAEEGRRRAQRRKRALRNAAAGKPFSRLVLGGREKEQIDKLKPHGLFVFLAMAAVLYPMFLSVFWSLGRKIPLVERIGIQMGEAIGLRWALVLGWLRAAVKSAYKSRSGVGVGGTLFG